MNDKEFEQFEEIIKRIDELNAELRILKEKGKHY